VKELQRRGDPNVVIALAGNKADMESKRKVQQEEAAQYALESDILHLETSAKTALNVRALFVEIGNLNSPLVFLSLLLLSPFCFLYYFISAKKLPKSTVARPEEVSFPVIPNKPASGANSSCC